MNAKNYFRILLIAMVCTAVMTFAHAADELTARADEKAGLTFEISYAKEANAGPITGRVYAIIARNDSRQPYLQTGYTGQPIWGKNIFALKPGISAVIDETVFGHPLHSISEIPPGEYFVQGFVNLYTEFKRSDGHTLWMHKDRWEGQNWKRSPGNMFSNARKVSIDPSKNQVIKLECTNVIPPVVVPPDSKHVKRIKFESKILSEFWGYPMHIGATMLLPKDYDKHPEVQYPVNYIQGHFSLGAPNGFREPTSGSRGNAFSQYWLSDECPRMIAITFQHPCPYFDDSYAVNSPNIGPFGDAIMKELIPAIEEQFRCIEKPYARVLSGGSTGGWESIALQVFYPDFFGGTWTGYPDPVDFRRFQVQNIYEDPNMYYKIFDWTKIDLPETRTTDGDVTITMADRCHYELAVGDHDRSGEQWAVWEALYSPLGKDGYPEPMWDWMTGEIHPEVAEQWKKYDISYILRNNWAELGPKLVGKLHLYTGDMDNAYLNLGVVLLEEFLESTTDPYYAGSVTYGDRGRHGWSPYTRQEFIQVWADHIAKNAVKAGDNPKLWQYK